MAYPTVALLGKQGSGKTTFVNSLLTPENKPSLQSSFLMHRYKSYALADTKCISIIGKKSYNFWKLTKAAIIFIDCTADTAVDDIRISADVIKAMSSRVVNKKFPFIPSVLVINKTDRLSAHQLIKLRAVEVAKTLKISAVIELSLVDKRNLGLIVKTVELLMCSSFFNPNIFYDNAALENTLLLQQQLEHRQQLSSGLALSNMNAAVGNMCDICFNNIGSVRAKNQCTHVCEKCRGLLGARTCPTCVPLRNDV